MKRALIAMALWGGIFGLTGLAGGTPKIQFDNTVYDFGKTSGVETVSGTFKFKNSGDAVLELQQPKTQCGCTVASLKKTTLEPGESGEIPFTLNLGRYKTRLEKHITVNSNDPQAPQVSLTIKADHTPLYDIAPMSLAANIPLGGLSTNFSITRTDGKPLPQLKFQSSKPWITAALDSSAKTGETSARVRVDFQYEGQPRRINEFIQVFLQDQTNTPLSTVMIYGRLMGELGLSPEALYWSVTDPAKMKTNTTEAFVTRRLSIKSNKGQEFTVKNPRSSIQGIALELVPREWKKPTQPGRPVELEKGYELVAKLNKIPEKTITGNVTFETSVASQAKVDVPVTVYVFQPQQQQLARPATQPAPAIVPTVPRGPQASPGLQTAPQSRVLTNSAQRTVALPGPPPPLPPASK